MSEHTDTLSDAELVERLAHAGVDRDTAEFHRGWMAHELRIHRCDDCATWHHPPRPMCPACWSWNTTATPVSGHGTIHLLMQLHQGPPAPGVDYAAGPYPVITVELDEQESLRYTSTLVDASSEQARIGQRVELAWIDRHGAPFPVFRPAGEDGRS